MIATGCAYGQKGSELLHVLLTEGNYQETTALVAPSFAQSNGVRANVPFDFTVGDKLLPAGTYTIKEQSEHVVVIKNHDKPIAAVSLVNGDSNKSPDGGKLKFHR